MRWLAKFLLDRFGWTKVGEIPALDKAVLVVAPHTSNWDGLWLIAYKLAMDLEVRFFAKHTLFWWPLGSVFRALGGMPVNRNTSASYVQQLVDAFARNDRLFLALAPEGTRKWQPYWKTGFYEIASAADVPIVLGFIDYGKKQMGIGPTLPRERNLEQDLEAIRTFYESKRARRPENKGPVGFPPDE